MAMTFFLHDNFQPNEPYEMIDHGSGEHREFAHEDYPLVRGKLVIPFLPGIVDRPRLIKLLTRSREQFPATLISGRSGTGKTAIAAQFACITPNTCWYTVEAADVEWSSFSRYFSAGLAAIGLKDPENPPDGPRGDVSQSDIARFLLRHFFRTSAPRADQPSLIVLDDIHHIFDAPWFEEFFYLLLYSLPPEVHLLMLCRSKPPAPIMRLRSKQMLNVLDEKVIAFTDDETEALFEVIGVSPAKAADARRESFGRVSKLLQAAR
jgi:LuxR family transcriptional regulator, maltose regulon positive regulatory protein